jgi:hypothetical protein
MQKLLTLVMLLWTVGASAQFSRLITNSEINKPLVVIVNQEENGQLIMNSIEALPESDQQRFHYFMLYGTNPTLTYMEKTLNDLLNKDKSHLIDKQRIYLLVLHLQDTGLQKAISNKSVFANVASVTLTPNQESVALQPILTKFAKNYLWEVEVDDLERRTKKVTYKNRRMGVGLLLGQNAQNIVAGDTNYLPSSITKFGLMANYRISNRFQVLGKVMTSFELPDQDGIQSSIFSQIDIAAGGEQTIRAEIKLHVYVQTSLQLNYIINPKNKLKAVTGIGVSNIVFTAAKQSIEQTIDISDITSGGGPGGGLGGGLAPDEGFTPLVRRFADPYLTAGLSYNASKNIDFVLNADYSFSKRAINVDGISMHRPSNPLSMNVGIQFTFGKGSKYYHYLNEKAVRR